MNDFWMNVGRWLCHLALSGGAILFLTCLVARRVHRPVRQQRLAEAGVAAALLVGVASLLPAWIVLPVPSEWLGDSGPVATAPVPTEQKRRAGFAVEADERRLNQDAGVSLSQRWVRRSPSSNQLEELPVTVEGNSSGIVGILIFLARRSLPGLGLVYAVIAVTIAGYWLLGCVALRRLVVSARPAAARVLALFCRMARRPYPRLLVSGRLNVPLCFGWRQPTVLVPAALADESDDRLRWVFAHELTHLERRDVLSALLFGAGQCVFFFVPWFWALRRQVRLCQEYVADAAAAEATGNPAAYAEFLLSLSAAAAPPVGAAAASGDPSDLFRRVTMLLEAPNKVERHCPRWWSLSAVSALTVLALGTAGVGLRASNATLSAEPARSAADDDQKKETPKSAQKQPKLDDKQKYIINEIYQDANPRVVVEPQTYYQPALINGQQAYVPHNLTQSGVATWVQSGQQNSTPPNLNAYGLWVDGLAGTKDSYWIDMQSSGRLGIHVQPPDATLGAQLGLQEGKGLVITQVNSGSAAEKAGVKVHDILLQFNGKDVANKPEELTKSVQAVKKGETVDLIVLRKGKKVTIENIKLPEKKQPKDLTIPLENIQQYYYYQLDPNNKGRYILSQPLNPGAALYMSPSDWTNSLFFHQGQGVMISNFRNNDNFTGRHQEGSLIITVTGKVKDGKSAISQIQVQDGSQTKKYDSVKDVPEQYRDKVKNLVESVQKTNNKIDFPAQPGGKQSDKNKKGEDESKDS